MEVNNQSDIPSMLDFSIKGSFPYTTIQSRMPVILTKALDNVHQQVREVDAQKGDVALAQTGIRALSQLKYEMQTSKPVRPLTDPSEDTEMWARYIEDQGVDGKGWYDCSWLFAECYMYRRIREALVLSGFSAHDPFGVSKQESYTNSQAAIQSLSEFVESVARSQSNEILEVFIEFSLWGNKCDLSLLTNIDTSVQGGMDHLQAGSQDQLAQLRSHVLVNDFPRLATVLVESAKKTPVGIVLDNAGFELFTDLCLAHFLVAAGYCTEVVLYVKSFPWFVSDAMEKDVNWIVKQLEKSADKTVSSLGKKFGAHLSEGSWKIRKHPFWTLPYDYNDMKATCPDLYENLGKCRLVIFKGDLNYRKLLGDRQWDYATPFDIATRSFFPTSICALRTNKANLICGVSVEKQEEAKKENADGWLTTGQFGVIQVR